MPNIVKHSYIGGPNVSGRAIAHINYIQYRPGDDKDKFQEHGIRDPERPEAFNRWGSARDLHVWNEADKEPGRAADEFTSALSDWDKRGKVVHKFILSPSEKDVDMDAYTKEIMQCLGQRKGQDLQYAWAVHDNTKHPHSHVVVLGKDLDGNHVRFDRTDHSFMRAYGDRYLEREHGTEMQYGKDIEMYARTHSHNLYLSDPEQNLRWLEKQERSSSWQSDEDFRHLFLINKNWNEALEGPTREGGLHMGSTWLHDRGRLSEIHDLYDNSLNTEKWKDIAENANNQSLKDYSNKQLAELQDQRTATLKELEHITGLTPASFDKFISGIQQQFAQENLEIDQVLNPEKYWEPQVECIEQEDMDFRQIKKEDQITLSGSAERILTKYDSAEDLDQARLALKAGRFDRLESAEYSKLCSWIGSKEKYGDDCFGFPPLKGRYHEDEHTHQADKPLNLDEISKQRPPSLDQLSDDLALDSKHLTDLLTPQSSREEVQNEEREDNERGNLGRENIEYAELAYIKAVNYDLPLTTPGDGFDDEKPPDFELDLVEVKNLEHSILGLEIEVSRIEAISTTPSLDRPPLNEPSSDPRIDFQSSDDRIDYQSSELVIEFKTNEELGRDPDHAQDHNQGSESEEPDDSHLDNSHPDSSHPYEVTYDVDPDEEYTSASQDDFDFYSEGDFDLDHDAFKDFPEHEHDISTYYEEPDLDAEHDDGDDGRKRDDDSVDRRDHTEHDDDEHKRIRGDR